MRKENEIRMESNRRLWGEGRAGTLPPRPQRMWRRPWSAGGKQATPASGRPPGSLNPRNREGAHSYLLKGELYPSGASIPKEEDGPGPGWNNPPWQEEPRTHPAQRAQPPDSRSGLSPRGPAPGAPAPSSGGRVSSPTPLTGPPEPQERQCGLLCSNRYVWPQRPDTQRTGQPQR